MTALPYGLRDVKVAPYNADGSIGTIVDLPNSQTLEFSEKEDYSELRGDDKVVAKRGNGATVDWKLGSGGISLEAYVILNGGTLEVSGVTPAVKTSYKKKTTDSRPDFWCEGQAISESGGDFHVVLERCKADGDINGSLSDGEFWVTEASGTGMGNLDDDLYEFVENETAIDIVAPA